MSKPAHIVGFGLDQASLDHTRDVFQPYSDQPLTREDCREIHRNLTGAFGVLLRVKRRLLERERAERSGGDEGAGAQSANPEVPRA